MRNSAIDLLLLAGVLVALLALGRGLDGAASSPHATAPTAQDIAADLERAHDTLRAVDRVIAAVHARTASLPMALPMTEVCWEPEALARAGGAALAVAGLDTAWRDPFAPADLPPAYVPGPDGRWLIFSPGPDRHYDLDPAHDLDWSLPTPDLRRSLAATGLTYDPTNGLQSRGDIWRTCAGWR